MTIAAADQLTMYRNMVLIRRFEEGVAEAYADGFIGGFTHLYIGQEAVATGAITALNHDDYVIGTYRVHAHALVRGTWRAAAGLDFFAEALLARHRVDVQITPLQVSPAANLFGAPFYPSSGPFYPTAFAAANGVSDDLLLTIFFPKTPLHDGAVIIRNNRILVARAVLPLATGREPDSHLGTRHLAAIGLTERTDAIVIVVSEETGIISIVRNGIIRRRLDEGQLSRLLYRWYQTQTQPSPDWFSRLLRPGQNGQASGTPQEEGLPPEEEVAREKSAAVGRSDG